MKAIWKLFKRHPAAILSLLIYTLICLGFLRMVIQFHERMKINPGRSGISLGGEGIGFGCFFLFLLGGMFFLVTCAFAIAKKAETTFYLLLCLLIVVETIAVFQIG